MIRRNNIDRMILDSLLEGQIARGRTIKEWMTNIKEWTGTRYEDLVRLTQDRERWRVMTEDLLEEDDLL